MGSLRLLVVLPCCWALLFLLNPQHVLAHGESAAEASPVIDELERYTLSNGLRIVLNPVPGSSTAGVCVTYDVGSRDEDERRTGLAHLSQHLMFQGSLNVDRGDHFRLVSTRGGSSKAAATKDVTNYVTEIPAGELELVLWLEADRMFRLALSREAFEAQREIVLEEVRHGYASNPFARGELRLQELVFQRYWAYEHPALGYLQDLKTVDYARTKQFYQQHYVPGRAVLAIAGGFDVRQVRSWIEKYFSDSPSPEPRPGPPEANISLPRQTSERLNVQEHLHAKTPGVYYGWRIPGARTQEHHALELASFILTGGETGRLTELLVHNEQAAQTVHSGAAGHADVDVFQIFVELNRRSTVDAMQKALEKSLANLATTGPSESELDRARLNLKVRWRRRMEKARNRAADLARTESLWGNASLLNEDYTAYDAITAAQVRTAVARHLAPTRRSVVEVYPPGWVRDIGPPIITATYVVKPGDNLTRIAQWHGTTPEAIAKQNGFGLSRRIVIGQRLLITANPSKIVKPITHTVAKGETLIGIGKRYGVGAGDIAKRNGLNTKKSIRPGQVLQIPPRPKSPPEKTRGKTDKDVTTPARTKDNGTTSDKSSANSQSSGAASAKSKGGTGKKPVAERDSKPARSYVVKAGDSLSVIAARHKVSVAALTRANGISKKKPIRPGQRLVIPDAE